MQNTSIPEHSPTHSPPGTRHPAPDQGWHVGMGAKKGAVILVVGAVFISAVAIAGVSLLLPSPAAVKPSAGARATVSPEEARRTAGYSFLNAWVDPDGRVVRRDQGGDTVSEGQAYGMLIALGAADEEKFDSIWAWTRQHLQRPDGLLAWRWSNGSVIDDEPAADADLDAARALVQAGIRFNRPDLTTAGHSLAATFLARLTAPTSRGTMMLPGFWAASEAGYSYNPSYASPAAFQILANSTGDPRWNELQLGARSIASSLLQAHPLPPDWARISTTGAVQALPGPTGQGPAVQYGYDASRLPIRYAESCTAEDVVLAAAVAPTLKGITPLVTVLDLDGIAISSDLNAISYTARAAAHAAAGDLAKAREDLNRAEDVNSLHPTYYGSAWLALTRNFLDSTVLGGCPPLAGRNQS